MAADILKDIGGRQPRPGFARRVGKGVAALATAGAALVDGSVDEQEMSASFVICSYSEDRDGDIIVPQGCRDYLDEYKANPVVLYYHDNSIPPVGLSEDPDTKRCTLRIYDDDRVTAKCYFHGKPFKGNNLSEEVFGLVVAGALRGASVGFLPMPEGTESLGYGRDAGKRYTKWRLTEWSITPQPANQDCLRAALSRGLVKTKSLMDHLTSTLPPAPSWANGVDLGATAMSKRAVGKITLAKSEFPTADAAHAWLKKNGRGRPALADFGDSWAAQLAVKPVFVGTKSLAKGVTALLVNKGAKNADDDEEEKDAPADAAPDAGMDDETVTKDDDSDEDAPEVDKDAADAEMDDASAPADEPAADHSSKEGAKALAAIAEHFDHLIASLPEFIGKIEQPDVVKCISQLQALGEKAHGIIAACCDKAYNGLDLDSIKPGNMQPEVAADPAAVDTPPPADVPPDAPPADASATPPAVDTPPDLPADPEDDDEEKDKYAKALLAFDAKLSSLVSA